MTLETTNQEIKDLIKKNGYVEIIVRREPHDAGTNAKGEKYEAFDKYYWITEDGRKVDLRFKRNVNTKPFESARKFKICVSEFQKANGYEYVRYYAGGYVEDTLEIIL